MAVEGVNWHDDEFYVKLDEANNDMTTALGFQILAEAIPHVRRDTGFLANSGYVHSPQESTFAAKTQSRGNREYRTASNPPGNEPDVTYVGFSASYALFVETRYPFLYPAMLRAQGEVGGIVQVVKSEHFD